MKDSVRGPAKATQYGLFEDQIRALRDLGRETRMGASEIVREAVEESKQNHRPPELG